MTPAIKQAQKAKIKFQTHAYEHDAQHSSYGLEAAEKLNLEPLRVFKTLVASLDNQQLVVCLVPVSQQLNLKQVAKTCAAKKAQMADKAMVMRSTGYVLGGVSPLGQKNAWPL